MALIAIIDGMTQCKGKKGVVIARSSPGKGGHRVAFHAFGGEVPKNMIGIVC